MQVMPGFAQRRHKSDVGCGRRCQRRWSHVHEADPVVIAFA